MSDFIGNGIFHEAAIQEALAYLEQKRDTCGVDGMYLSELRSYWEINGESILKELERGSYEPGLVRITEILGRDGKRRKISVFCSIDRLLLRCLERFLQGEIDPILHECCFAFRANRGVTAAVSKMIEYIKMGYTWEARVDIRDFFDNIPLQQLEQRMGALIADGDVTRLLLRYLHLRIIVEDEIKTVTRGVLQGCPLSPHLANLYLASHDEWLDSLGVPFCRYADDIVVCFSSKQEAERFYPGLIRVLKQDYELEVNQKKSGVLETARQQFLGYSFHIDRDGESVTAFKAKHTFEEVNRDWRQGHIEKIDRNYHIINGGVLSKKDYNLLFENEEGKHYIPVETMGALNIYSDVTFNSDFFRFAAKKRLYVTIFDQHGNMVGSFIPADNGYRSKTMLRQAALYLNEEKRLQIARLIELGAFHNLRANLRYYAKVRRNAVLNAGIEGLGNIMRDLEQAENIEQMLLLEARGRQFYYTMFNEIMGDPAFRFTTRTRQPPLDALNAMISFGNTYLYNRIATEINKTALDIRVGFLHATNKRSQSLNLDIAELFKPVIVDRAIFTLVNRRIINASEHFETGSNGGVFLNKEGMRIYINELDAKVYQKQTENNRPVTYDTRIRNEVGKILKLVNYGKAYRPYKYY